MALFVVCFLLGIVAVLGGVGGGVLFVPIVGGFFPFHIDFIRCAGLLLALSAALASSPKLLRSGLTNLRLALPIGLITSISSIAGARVGLALPQHIVNLALGCAILGIVAVMLLAKKEESTGQDIPWKPRHTAVAFALFVVIGFLAGMFGLGAGWANVPVLNLLMGVPLKVAVASSMLILSIADTSAAWIYINKGAVLAVVVVPSMMGMMLGSRIGAHLLAKAKPSCVRWIVIALLLVAGLRALLKGMGV